MEILTDIWGDLRTRVRRFVGNRVNDPHAADDITQDVMLKVQTRLDTLLPEDKLPAWTIAVARNAIIDHYRARAVRDHGNVTDVEPPAGTTGTRRSSGSEMARAGRRRRQPPGRAKTF
jgi:RNA polymerase sigma factor (sigma-70 family)